MRFDPAKLTDLVTEESRLTAELQTVSVRMNERAATDEWDEGKLSAHTADNIRHAQLTRERDSVRAERQEYEGLTPASREAQEGVIARFMRGGDDALSAEELESFAEGEDWRSERVAGQGRGLIIRSPQAATRSDDVTGQDAVQETVAPRIVDTLAYYGGTAKVAQHFMTGTGGDYNIPQMDADGDEGYIIGAQNTDRSTDDPLPNITDITFTAKTFTSDFIPVTREMIQDSVFDIQRYVERQAVRRIGKISNRAFTVTQTGSGLPQGIVSGAAAGVTAAGADTIAWKETVDLEYSVNRAYREMGEEGEGGFMPEGGGMIGYMVSDDCEKNLRTLVDTDGRPLWMPSIRQGTPNMFNGWPVVVNGHMAAVTTGAVPMLFGNFAYYGIRTVRAIEIFRFFDSKTARQNRVECVAFARRDGRFMGPTDAIKKLTMA